MTYDDETIRQAEFVGEESAKYLQLVIKRFADDSTMSDKQAIGVATSQVLELAWQTVLKYEGMERAVEWLETLLRFFSDSRTKDGHGLIITVIEKS